MKKLLFISAVLLLLSCDKDKEDCKCDGKFSNVNIYPNYYIKTIKIDCETGQPTEENNDIFIGCK